MNALGLYIFPAACQIVVQWASGVMHHILYLVDVRRSNDSLDTHIRFYLSIPPTLVTS